MIGVGGGRFQKKCYNVTGGVLASGEEGNLGVVDVL